MSDAFRSFHRARWRASLRVRVPLCLLAGAIVVVGAWGIVSAPPPSTTSRTGSAAVAGAPDSAAVQSAAASPLAGAPAVPIASGVVPAAAVAAAPVVPVAPVAPVAPGVPTPLAPTPVYTIAVTASGYQRELDACQWVRMDVGAIAPIVGAHNFCHGDIVLALAVGDVVTVTGASLDGDYQVTGSRDARAGDDAAKATEGLAGDLLLQTCYWESARGLRLVTAVKVDLSLPPTVVG